MGDNRPTLAQYFVEQACPDNRFLEEMNNVIPWWEIESWFKGHLKKERKKTGRPPYPIILMFKIHLIQQWYNLSDRETEFQICDRLSFRKFLGLGIEDNVPDATTIENFRHFLEERKLNKVLIAVLDKYFKEIGLIKKEGNIVDATFMRANSKPHIDPNKNSDVDASLGHKGFGYSGTINMYRETKLVRATEVTPANVLDYKSLESVILGDEKELYADRGYAPSRKMMEEKHPEIVSKIMYKRQRGKKGIKYVDLDVFRSYHNQQIAKERARVEHVFAALKTVFRFTRLRYRGLERVTAKFESLIIAYNFYRLGFLLRTRPKCA